MTDPILTPASESGTVTVASPPEPPRTARENLRESWPLFFLGSACLVIGALLALNESTRTIEHLSPAFLFLAVGITGLAGGVASYAIGPDEEPDPAVRSRIGRTGRSVQATVEGSAVPADQWNGRPVPDVIAVLPGYQSERIEDEDWKETPDSLRFDPGTYVRPPAWARGRVLHLSSDGTLTVYALEDALRDLELVNAIVHRRLAGQATDGKTESDAASK